MVFNPSLAMSHGLVPCPARPSHVSPWLAPFVYQLGSKVVLPSYFDKIEVSGQENLPRRGPVVLAPTHQARWDSLLVAHVANEATGRYLRFMVTADECVGLQGWVIKHLGGFPVNVQRPAIATLRHGVELLRQQQMLVIFPEGNIFRDGQVHRLKPGLARLALQAQQSSLDRVKVVPMSLQYDRPYPTCGSSVHIRIGAPLEVFDYRQGNLKARAKLLTADLQTALEALSGVAAPQPVVLV
ncbi:MAG: 1-acyl-sn-glycerol-3-phosphate acyltransferase [Leptolyngbya sp. SIO4C1]|nr:1-acyl-sn-glycerol-3-phosphate acyltransferase [Leptolyngbya sp. SIO4C1]